MNNHWVDLKNAKVFLIGGSNTAENHVMAARWITRAKEQGAVVIQVDPRINRTTTLADIFARVRPGGDIAYLGAVIYYILENKLYDEPYVTAHTNALSIMGEEFGFDDGLFAGFDEKTHKYDTHKWEYALDPKTKTPLKAESLDDPRTVFSALKKHYSRYTLEMGEKISGIPAEKIKLIAETFAKNKPGTILYALGMTQHTVGVQNIRCYCILQLLLGNIGVAGGGVNALRGEPNVQGACDMAVLYNYFPGYLSYPGHNEPTLEAWTKNRGTFRAKFLINGLKAWFGDAATAENEYGYGWLPKRNATANYSIFKIFENAIEGKTKFLYLIGQNPRVTQPNLKLVAKGLANLEMLVVQELWETETACFWQAPGVDAKAINTEVILLPATYFMEKDGTISGSGRMVQWRYKAVAPPGDAREDIEIIDAVYKKLRDLYKDSTKERDQIFKRTVWNYDHGPSKAEEVLKEINGRNLVTKEFIKGIGELKADGTTSSGSWIYAGIFAGGKNLTKRRDNKTDPSGLGIYPKFAWTWPGNMHILYNRASADKDGKPFDPKRALVWWDAEKKEWTGHDTPDVPVKTDGPDTPNGQRAFRMNAEGLGRLIAVSYKSPDPDKEGMPKDSSGVPADGPMPEFYEPVESPVANLLHPKVQNNPCLKYPRIKELQPIGTVKDFPYVLMTASFAEHWCAGSTTRNIPWLNELVPEPWIELPEKLAKQLNIKPSDRVKVASARSEITVKAMVTKRMEVMQINGKEVPVVYMPYNWGFKGLSTGPSTNELTIDAGDPNVWCQETKACLVNVTLAGSKKGA
jgi:formate dehydrogenase major subunit